MTGETLKPEIAELFRKYRESDRHIFLEVILWPSGFIAGAACTADELDAIYTACVARARKLRAPRGRKRGRPRTGTPLVNDAPHEPVVSELAMWLAGGGSDEKLLSRDQRQHGWFRDVWMVCGDRLASRLLLLEQTCLFIDGANMSEVRAIRQAVSKRRRTVRRSQRGRPDVRIDEELMGRARQVAWMRVIDRRSDEKIANELDMPLIESVRNPSGLIELPGNLESVKRQLRRLEDYLAAAIWRAIPLSVVRVSGTGREIAPGALDSKSLQTYIWHRTGLPFRTHPEECKCIVRELWPRGSAADSELFERGFAYRQKKRHS